LNVDKEKWQRNANRRSPRPQPPAINDMIRKQLLLRENLNVIQISQASAWSQVHMVPKPDSDEKRMTIDFRELNDASTVTSSWPIPNIDTLLNRVMNKKPKFFFTSTMDLDTTHLLLLTIFLILIQVIKIFLPMQVLL